jgi:hypothetical protein
MSNISKIPSLCTYPQDFIISLLDFRCLYEKNIKIRKNALGKVST